MPLCGWERTATTGSAAAAGGTTVRLRARTQQRELQSRWLHSSINSTHAHSHACKQMLMFQIYAPPSLLQEGSRVLNTAFSNRYMSAIFSLSEDGKLKKNTHTMSVWLWDYIFTYFVCVCVLVNVAVWRPEGSTARTYFYFFSKHPCTEKKNHSSPSLTFHTVLEWS